MVRPRHGWLPGAFAMLTLALKEGLALGGAYGIWSAGGVAVTAIASRILFGEPLTRTMMAGIALIMTGVLLVEFGSAHWQRTGGDPGQNGQICSKGSGRAPARERKPHDSAARIPDVRGARVPLLQIWTRSARSCPRWAGRAAPEGRGVGRRLSLPGTFDTGGCSPRAWGQNGRPRTRDASPAGVVCIRPRGMSPPGHPGCDDMSGHGAGRPFRRPPGRGC